MPRCSPGRGGSAHRRRWGMRVFRSLTPRTLLGGAVLGLVFIVLSATPGFAVPPNIVIGPQAMEGDLKVMPGDVLSAGISFTMPGTHPEATVGFGHPNVVFDVQCVTGSGGGSVLIKLLLRKTVIPENDSSWF